MTTLPPAEHELHPLDRRVRVLWWISAGIGALPAVGAAAAAWVAVGGGVAVAATALALVVLVAAVVVPALRYTRWRYAVRQDDIWVREGVWWVQTTVVPFSRLQFVDTRQGPLDRALGLASLDLHTAALGSTTTIPGLALAQAEALRERLADVDPDLRSV